MILDGHIHSTGKAPGDDGLLEKMKAGGVDGGVILSEAPKSFKMLAGQKHTKVSEKLDDLLSWTKGRQNLYPFYWIDPVEKDAVEQVEIAADRGVAGFKIICNSFYPYDERAMKVYRAIAKRGKPVLFHSGILWDGQFSSIYNRPAGFEALLEIGGLKFALAHISWPWCDECIAVYGKFQNALSAHRDMSVEMFIDITPGTPPIYREDALTKLYSVGYDLENNVLFGLDCLADDYDSKWAQEWIERDNMIYDRLGLSDTQREKLYSGNLKRFLTAK